LLQHILKSSTGDPSSILDGVFKEKDRSYSWPKGENISSIPIGHGMARWSEGERKSRGSERELRHLPVDQSTFKAICQKFCVHSSIARVVSRADVPVFSRAEVQMKTGDTSALIQPTIGIYKPPPKIFSIYMDTLTIKQVYNCRSANDWRDDLALTVTHFPNSGLTFAMLFGCTLATEKQVFNRVLRAQKSAHYPLLLPGIFVELELVRITKIVDTTIDGIERAIVDLEGENFVDEASAENDDDKIMSQKRNTRKKVWLDTTFLRSRLQIWRTQLQKMVEHADELLAAHSSSLQTVPISHTKDGSTLPVDENRQNISQTYRTGFLIKDRLRDIIHLYDEYIEECSMRLDGMTIATQWVRLDRKSKSAIVVVNSCRPRTTRMSISQLLRNRTLVR
jgi:hypothetical protein